MAKILGVKIDNVSFPEAISRIKTYLMVDELHMVATVNPEFLVAAQKDEKFKDILNKTDLNVPDGVGLKFGAWILGQKIGERITGVDLTWEIAKVASENNYSIFFLGAAEGVAQKTVERIKMLYPNLKVAGTYAGTPEEEGIVTRINNSSPDFLLVAFGAPKQEKFLATNSQQLKAKLSMGVGGAFDYIAGIVPYAPSWMRKLGLEWLYRLFTQPQRWKRILTATIVFPWMVIVSRFKK